MSTQRTKRPGHNRGNRRRSLSEDELRVLTYLGTLVFAAFLAEKGVDTPTIYGFLGMSIGAIFGKYFQKQ